MASDDTKFSHITVHADDDDEFVIQAGIRAHAPVEPAAESDGAVSEPGEGAPVDASFDDREGASGEEPAPSAPAKARDEEYRQTTVDDLKAAPMSGMQKAIIAIALLCVFGSVAYYMFFMR